MSDGPLTSPRSSIDHRYEREAGTHDAAHPAEAAPSPPAQPPYPHHPGAIAIANPLGPTITYNAPQQQPTVVQGPTVVQPPGMVPGMVPGAVGGVAPGYVYPGAMYPGQIVMPSPVIVQPPAAQQPVLGIPAGSVTVINNPPPAGSPCPICGKPLGEAVAHKPHEPPKHPALPAAPRFSKATPEVFRDGFKPLWDAAQADTAAFVVVSGCNKLLDVLLKDLEGRSYDAPKAKARGGFVNWWTQPAPEKPTFAGRIEALQKKGFLLGSTVEAAKRGILAEVLTEKIDPGAVSGDMAKRYVQLLWQVADQGFEQPGWSQSGEFPKAVPGPASDHPPHAPAAPAAQGEHKAPPSGPAAGDHGH